MRGHCFPYYCRTLLLAQALAFLSFSLTPSRTGEAKPLQNQYEANPFVFALAQRRPDERVGSIVAADVNNDGLLDYLYTTPGSLGAYDHFGSVLWVKHVDIHLTGQAESEGLPGLHAPGVQAGDVDGDGKTEVLFLTTDRRLIICDGATGQEKSQAKPPVPEGVARWEHLLLCNLRGEGDRDVVLQATAEADRYKLGRFVTALAAENLQGEPLWATDHFRALAHGPLRAADLDGDGRDELCGLSLYDHDGTLLTDGDSPKEAWHIDSLFIYDVRPDLPGLEALVLEEGSNHVMLLGAQGRIWRTHHERQEPQNAALGEFDLSRPGLEIWCRSRYDEYQKPWVFDAQGNVIVSYELSKVAPPDWTVKGVEEISVIDWDGGARQLAAAKERHEEGDVCIFDPMTGEFVQRFTEQAARLYVADVSGDWREELVVVNGSEIHIYWNPAPNPDPNRPPLWTHDYYRRSKMNWNYYSP